MSFASDADRHQCTIGFFLSCASLTHTSLNGAGHRDLIELLIKRHANFKATNGKNKTPMDIAKNITTRQLLQESIAALPQQPSATASAEGLTAQTSHSQAKIKSHSTEPAVPAEGTGISSPQPATAAAALESSSMDAMPSAEPSAQQGAGSGDIGPQLPPRANLASADPPDLPAETRQETGQAQIGPMLPPGVILAVDGSFEEGNKAQAGSDSLDAARSSEIIDTRDTVGPPDDTIADGADASQHQPPGSSKAHVRRKRDEPEVDGPDGVSGSLVPVKKAKVSLAHLGDEEEDI